MILFVPFGFASTIQSRDGPGGSGSSPFQYEMEGVQLKAEIDLKSIYGLKSATPFKIYLTEQ